MKSQDFRRALGEARLKTEHAMWPPFIVVDYFRFIITCIFKFCGLISFAIITYRPHWLEYLQSASEAEVMSIKRGSVVVVDTQASPSPIPEKNEQHRNSRIADFALLVCFGSLNCTATTALNSLQSYASIPYSEVCSNVDCASSFTSNFRPLQGRLLLEHNAADISNAILLLSGRQTANISCADNCRDHNVYRDFIFSYCYNRRAVAFSNLARLNLWKHSLG